MRKKKKKKESSISAALSGQVTRNGSAHLHRWEYYLKGVIQYIGWNKGCLVFQTYTNSNSNEFLDLDLDQGEWSYLKYLHFAFTQNEKTVFPMKTRTTLPTLRMGLYFPTSFQK